MSYQEKLFPLDTTPPIWYNTRMKYTVHRYHNPPQTFNTLAEAEEFAMNCGDMEDLTWG